MPDLPSTLPFVQADKVRLLALTGSKGEATLPGVRTVAQSGVEGFEIVAWLGLMAPANTPQPIVDKLEAAMVQVMQSDAVRLFVERAQDVRPGFELNENNALTVAAFMP